jgi:hypothetical protein
MGETSPNSGPFEPNTLFLGGEAGSDTAMMFHKYDLQGITAFSSSIETKKENLSRFFVS